MSVSLQSTVRFLMEDVTRFSEAVVKRPLRPYQAEIARAVAMAALAHHGDTLTVMMARQMGKNEI